MLSDTYKNRELIKAYEYLDTPFLSIDKQKFLHNLNHLRRKIEHFGVELRPHFKTIRAVDAARYILPKTNSPVTVSTLKEAEVLAEAGYTNIIYAVGISETKLQRVLRLKLKGAQISVLLDSVEQAKMINDFCIKSHYVISALIEIDCDGHRGGIEPDNPLLIEVAKTLHEGAAEFRGVLTHAGESYNCYSPKELHIAAANEVKAAVSASHKLRVNDIPCEVVSIGSTPTAHSYENLKGVTEVRAGVYSFFDLVMAGIGVCSVDDIALRVTATVIGHNKEKGWLLIDAGWMALSTDRGTASQPRDCGYGLVVDGKGECVTNLQVSAVNQEHGIIKNTAGDTINYNDFPIGSRVHILPNHACATTAMHEQYHVFDTLAETYEVWSRIKGW